MLSFAVARGSVDGVIRALLLLREHCDVTLACASLLRSLDDVIEAFWKRKSQLLKSAVCFAATKDQQLHVHLQLKRALWTLPYVLFTVHASGL